MSILQTSLSIEEKQVYLNFKYTVYGKGYEDAKIDFLNKLSH